MLPKLGYWVDYWTKCNCCSSDVVLSRGSPGLQGWDPRRGHPPTMSVVYLNGEFQPADKASISVLDRGFLFADGVYEVIRVYRGAPFLLERHLQRLQASLGAISIDNPLPFEQWAQVIAELINQNGGGDQVLYVQVTRGAGASREHVPKEALTPTLLMMADPTELAPLVSVAAITAEDIRWAYCHIKSVALLPNVLLRQQAVAAGAYEAILLRNGTVTEGAASSVFVVLDGVVVTPPLSPGLLAGVTRGLLLELLQLHDIKHKIREINESELPAAEEIWLSSTTRAILPVVQLDGRTVGNGQVGRHAERALRLYSDYRDEVTRALELDQALAGSEHEDK